MNTPSDEQLVAYLDAEIDAGQRNRIDTAIADDPLLNLRVQWLDRSSLPFKEAYDELASQAPLDRLQARLDAAPSPERPSHARRWLIGAAAVGLVLFGAVADHLFVRLLA